ncbi:MAG: hypothetical protein GY868_04495, partial [Deltaproteobacteria bacterium]|nr:hypothetical protein [Deltaproteobacteria bacterium]
QRETYSEIKEFFNLGERPDIKQTGITDIPDMFVIKIELKQLRFLCFPEGILNQELILP